MVIRWEIERNDEMTLTTARFVELLAVHKEIITNRFELDQLGANLIVLDFVFLQMDFD